MRRIRLLIVNKNPATRTHLKTLVAQCPAVEVVGEAGSGSEAIRKVSAVTPDVVLLSVMLEASLSAYVEKLEATPGMGQTAQAREKAKILSNSAAAPEPPLVRGSLLSPREREVLLLLAKGYTNREIADRIFRSVKTVETYRASIKRKLGLRNRAEIFRYARAAGLLNRTV